MSALANIRTAFEADVVALIAKYPAQEQNRAHYASKAASLKLGRLRARVHTKLHDFPRGTIVGFVTSDDQPVGRLGAMVPCVSIFAPGITTSVTMTITRASNVAALCERCEGMGAVRPHPTALVAVRCPSCGT